MKKNFFVLVSVFLFIIFSATGQSFVYVCTGKDAYAYHSRMNCSGLNKCQGEVKMFNETTAREQLDRLPCCLCWNDVSGRCREDGINTAVYPNNNTITPETYVYAAVAVVSLSAFILSNDFYLYPTFSFYKKDKTLYYNSPSSYNTETLRERFGWSIGLRKRFKNSALEYGASWIKSIKEKNYRYSYIIQRNVEEFNRLGFHLSYVHNIFPQKMPDNLRVYVGPSLNVILRDLSYGGYGGIVGSSVRLVDRLFLDVRYERTTQTNQIQAGLIFTYQKKYFWQK